MAAFCGFVSMCIWADYNNSSSDFNNYSNDVLGSSFVLIVVSWMTFAFAAVLAKMQHDAGRHASAHTLLG